MCWHHTHGLAVCFITFNENSALLILNCPACLVCVNASQLLLNYSLLSCILQQLHNLLWKCYGCWCGWWRVYFIIIIFFIYLVILPWRHNATWNCFSGKQTAPLRVKMLMNQLISSSLISKNAFDLMIKHLNLTLNFKIPTSWWDMVPVFRLCIELPFIHCLESLSDRFRGNSLFPVLMAR